MGVVSERRLPSESDRVPADSPSTDVVGSEPQQPAFPSSTEFFANPLAAIRRIHEDMDRIFAQAWGPEAGAVGSGGASSKGDVTAWSPVIEMNRQGDNLVVYAELPGLKPAEVQVEVTQNTLVIQGERRRGQTTAEGAVRHTERSYGRFYRAIPLPEGANGDAASATFHDGVLEVHVPYQPQQLRRRQIPIASDPAPRAVR